MLRWIRVRNVAVIEDLEIDLEPGLNLLTGETGAGKSILVDALGLLLGSRASADLLRSGARSARVEAVFELEPFPEPLRRRLEATGVETDNGQVVLRREITAGGRSKVFVNGSVAAISLLRDLAPYLADIHGQGEHISLLRPGAELELLDKLGEHHALREDVAQCFRDLKGLENELAELEVEARDRRARQDLAAFQLAEIEKAAPQVGEDRHLEEERRLLTHEEKLRAAAEEAYGALYEEEASVLARLALVWKRVSELADIDPRLSPFVATGLGIRSQLEDLALFLRDYREQIRFTPGRLDEVEERLALLERLKKKYGRSLEAVVAHQATCRETLERLETQESRLAELQAAVDEAAETYEEKALELSEQRRHTAERLEKRVEKELRGLAMEKARFAIRVLPAAAADSSPRAHWREHGLDAVELLFSANPGEDLRLLSRIASGGESSRFMLALKSVAMASQGESSKTLVFDEVDTGIEGRVADIVGEKLKKLSHTHQVLCITHLPQIARFADVHYRIEKLVSRGRTQTRAERLDRTGRINEIARMIAGARITESARQHAEQLVAEKNQRVKADI